MALTPTITACSKNGCSKLTITDTTGAYDVSTNPGGWGSPNLDPTDTSPDFKAAIEITTGGNTTTTVVTSQVPTTVTGNFTYDDIEVGLTDGWVTIKYILEGSENLTIIKKIFVYCDIKCCVETKMASMKDLDPCKDASELIKYFHMYNLYKTMLFEANGCNWTEASTTLARLQKLCNIDADCGCS